MVSPLSSVLVYFRIFFYGTVSEGKIKEMDKHLKQSRYGKWQLNRRMILPYQTLTITMPSINQHVDE